MQTQINSLSKKAIQKYRNKSINQFKKLITKYFKKLIREFIPTNGFGRCILNKKALRRQLLSGHTDHFYNDTLSRTGVQLKEYSFFIDKPYNYINK